MTGPHKQFNQLKQTESSDKLLKGSNFLDEINIYDASQVQPKRIFNLAVLVLPKLYSGYSVRLICLTLLRLVPSFIYRQSPIFSLVTKNTF